VEHDTRSGDSVPSVDKWLDEASRAYMEGEYDGAVTLWKRVLEAEPENARARQGIKKVHMLQAQDLSDAAEDQEPAVLAQVRSLMEQRHFEEAARLCQEEASRAGATLRVDLNRCRQEAERARAIEPEIQRCVANARRELAEGNLREAIPHLKQVLALDRRHPVAVRLMDAIRTRAERRRGGSRPAPQAEGARPDFDGAELPSSGMPGCDAVPFSLDSLPEPPAPPGKGLPSSPVTMAGQDSVPEIELEGLSFEPEAGHGAGGDPVEDEIVEDDLEPLKLRTSAGGEALDSRRTAQAVQTTESPFLAAGEDQLEHGPAGALDDFTDVGGSGAEGSGRTAVAPLAAPTAKAKLESRPEDRQPDLGDPDPGSGFPAALPSSLPGQGPQSAARPLTPILVGAGLALLAGAAIVWWTGLLGGGGKETMPVPPHAAPPGEVAPEAAPAPAPEAADPGPSAAPAETRPAQATEERTAAPRTDPKTALTLLEKGRDLMEAGDFAAAEEVFAEALGLDPVNAEIATWHGRATTKAEEARKRNDERDAALAAFERRDFENALRRFYRLQEQEPGGAYERYIAIAWYNWGLEFLAAGNLREADVKMNEVLTLNADDADAKGIKELVAEYANRAKDRAFYTRIQALRYRSLPG
jgi:tetratricopeptide (TPR) repeat protein